MLRLRVKAPFASFRYFTAGSYRPSAPFVTPSAAYGLILNLAGIESRLDDGRSPMTLMRTDLPDAQIAIGAVVFPEFQTIYQQLHNYPVGDTGKDHAPKCKGAKYNIQPIRREFLADIDTYLCLRKTPALEEAVRFAIQPSENACKEVHARYGIPFLGDNNFMIDVIKEESNPQPAYWYLRLAREDTAGLLRPCRLTVWIDRADMTRTVAALYAPTNDKRIEPPEEAWTQVGPSASQSPVG